MVLVFDYDGTIHNTKHLYGNAFRAAYEKLVKDGYAPEHYYSDDDMAQYLGLAPPVMWNTFMPELPSEIKQRSSFLVRQGMITGIENGKAVLYPGAAEVLNELKSEGYTMVLLSNCYVAYSEAHRKYFELDQWFDGFYRSEDYEFIPKEKIFEYIVRDFPDSSYIVIGDRDSDFRVGKEHGIPVIGCAYGFGTEEELSMCDAVASSPEDLPSLIHEYGIIQ